MSELILSGTGHRPHRLGGYNPHTREKTLNAARRMVDILKPDLGIIGLALGWDQSLGLALKERGIPYWCAMPFKGQESKWNDEDQGVFHFLCEHAQRVHIVCEGGYAPEKLVIRDRWMVDNSNAVGSLFDGEKGGGTWQTIKYALRLGRPIHNAWSLFEGKSDELSLIVHNPGPKG